MKKSPIPTREKRFNRSFKKDDARHYVIYAELSKLRVPQPYLRADDILQALKNAQLL